MCGAVSRFVVRLSIHIDFDRPTVVLLVIPMVLMVVAALSTGKAFLHLRFSLYRYTIYLTSPFLQDTVDQRQPIVEQVVRMAAQDLKPMCHRL
jgi:hypothetical protein